jgi:neutral ceramidase
MRTFLKVIGVIVTIIVIIGAICIKPLDRTSYTETLHFKEWKAMAAALKFENSNNEIEVSWATETLTPTNPVPMAGYGVRKGKHFTDVHDSLFVKTIALKSGNLTQYFVSADMLIIPPSVLQILKTELSKNNINWQNIHFSATHTHNSLGGWGNTVTGKVFAGNYDPKIEHFIANSIKTSLINANKNFEKCKIEYGEIVDNQDIRNRLNIQDGKVDTEIRALRFTTTSGKIAQLVTYGAHATTLNSATMSLSRDYPGVLVDSLEKNVDFAMYMAGAVGSMGPIEKGKDDFDEVKNQGIGVYKVTKSIDFQEINTQISSVSIQLPMPEPAPKISQDWALRPFVFRYLFGDYPTYLKVTKIGKVLMIGTPCDFSGELMIDLDKYAKSKGLDLIITSFNGSYVGYITHDRLFEKDLYETRTMAWFGYQNGGYFSEIVRDIIDKSL